MKKRMPQDENFNCIQMKGYKHACQFPLSIGEVLIKA